MFLDRVVHFGAILGDQVKGHPTRKLKSLRDVPYVMRRKILVSRLNMNLVSSVALRREPLSTILAFSVNDPLHDLKHFPEMDNSV